MRLSKIPLVVWPVLTLGVGSCAIVADGVYIVDEGKAAVITHWGQAVGQETPAGIQFKMPIKTGVIEFDVREQRSNVELAAATGNQLPITATISVNWRIDGERVRELYTKYGSPSAFASNILGPRLRQAAKAGLSKFQADEMIRNRTEASGEIMNRVISLMEAYPAIVESVQIENIVLPPSYLDAVLAKEKAREDADKEKYNLQKQDLVARQDVQTANATRDSTKARADGEAYSINTLAEANAKAVVLKGEAEAKALKAVEQALKGNPLLVSYEQAKRWDGVLPHMVMGGETDMLMNIGTATSK